MKSLLAPGVFVSNNFCGVTLLNVHPVVPVKQSVDIKHLSIGTA